jgi:hypothetical protein
MAYLAWTEDETFPALHATWQHGPFRMLAQIDGETMHVAAFVAKSRVRLGEVQQHIRPPTEEQLAEEPRAHLTAQALSLGDIAANNARVEIAIMRRAMDEEAEGESIIIAPGDREW